MLSRTFSTLLLASIAACSGQTTVNINTAGAQGGSAGSSAGTGPGGSAGSGAAGGTGASGGTTASGGTGGAATGGASGSGIGGSSSAGGPGDAGVDAAGMGGMTTDAGCTDAPQPTVEDAIRNACTVALLRVSRIDTECSGAGGDHITFDVVELGRGSTVTKVHAGEHAYYPPMSGPNAVGQYFVAAVTALGKLEPRDDNPGWCISGLPPVDGHVPVLDTAVTSIHTYAYERVATQAEGSARMKQLLTGS